MTHDEMIAVKQLGNVGHCLNDSVSSLGLIQRMTPQEQLEIVQAYIAGKKIQYQPLYSSKWGADSICGDGYEFNFQQFRYRIKPEPMEIWVNVYPEPRASASYSLYKTEDEAMRFRGANARTIKFREVLDE